MDLSSQSEGMEGHLTTSARVEGPRVPNMSCQPTQGGDTSKTQGSRHSGSRKGSNSRSSKGSGSSSTHSSARYLHLQQELAEANERRAQAKKVLSLVETQAAIYRQLAENTRQLEIALRNQVCLQEQQVPSDATADYPSSLTCEGPNVGQLQPDEQVVPVVTSGTSDAVEQQQTSSPLSSAELASATSADADVPSPLPKARDATHDETLAYQRLVDEVQYLRAVIHQKDASLADSAFHLQQHSYMLAQRDAELGRLHVQLDQSRVATAGYRRDQTARQYMYQQSRPHMTEFNMLLMDNRDMCHGLRCLQGEVSYLQEELHTARQQKADQAALFNRETADLSAKVSQLQLQNSSLDAEMSQADHTQTQKFRAQLREQRQGHL